MRLILALIVVSLNQVFGENGSCCNKDEYVVFLPTNKFSCYDGNNTTLNLKLRCENPDAFEDFEYTINSKNQLEINGVELESGEYCLGSVITQLNPLLTEDQLLLCASEEKPFDTAIGYCLAVSAVFYLITAAIYIALSELRDLQGKFIITLCLCLGVGLSVLSIMKLLPNPDLLFCTVRAFIVYIFLIASFFWTNVISINCLISLKKIPEADYGWRTYILYSIYPWVMTAVMTIITAVVNFLPGDHKKPQIGLDHCWFADNTQLWIYFYSVMSILTLVNAGIFVYMIINLWRDKFDSNYIRTLKFKLKVSGKLFIIMGLPWFLEMISSLVNNSNHALIYLIDTITALQGLALFLVLVVLRTRTIKAMNRRRWFSCMGDRVDRYLAVANDEEEDIIEHIDIPLDNRD